MSNVTCALYGTFSWTANVFSCLATVRVADLNLDDGTGTSVDPHRCVLEEIGAGPIGIGNGEHHYPHSPRRYALAQHSRFGFSGSK